MDLRYGLKEVANVIFFDASTNKPAIFFDTLKVSTIENASESAEAKGGQGNGRLMVWDYGRTATLTMQDALLSDASLNLLSGNSVQNKDVTVVGRDVKTIGADKTITLDETPLTGSVSVYLYENGLITKELSATVLDDTVTLSGVEAVEGKQVMAFYEYTVADASKITFSANAFPATYKVVGDTVVRGEDGIDRKMQFVIPKAKLQSNFTLTMDAENVSTFDFTLDVLVSKNAQGEAILYDIIRL